MQVGQGYKILLWHDSRHDSLSCKWNAGVEFSVPSFMDEVYGRQAVKTLPPKVIELIWKKRGPLRTHLTLWFLFRERLKCGELLNSLNLISK